MLLDSALVTAIVLLTVTTASLLVAQARMGRRLTDLERQLRRRQRQTERVAGPFEMGVAMDPAQESAGVEGDAVDIEGAAPNGERVTIPLERTETTTLLAFLSSSCGTCVGIWNRLSEEGATVGDKVVVVVTKDPAQEDVERVRQLAGNVPTVMSSEAWDDYEVPRSPYVIVAGGRPSSVIAEGAVDGWDGLVALASRTERPS